jgi:hypothetical protein
VHGNRRLFFYNCYICLHHDGKTTKFAGNLHILKMQSVLNVSGGKYVVLATVGLAPVGRNTEKMSR